MATNVLGLHTFTASEPWDFNIVNDNSLKIENGVKTAMQGRAAHNILKNSDFSASRFIATAGINATIGTTPYVGDKWIGHTDITPTAKTEGMLLATTNQYAFIQQRVKVTQGKTYTLALSTTVGTTMQRIAVFNIGLTEIFASVEGSNGVIIATFDAAYDDMAMLLYPGYASGGGSAVFQWAALYEGAYTADTLPAYVPVGKHVEMLNCGVSLAPHNLLDNSDFRNPVNQRGNTSYTSHGYTIDRWTASSLTVGSSGVTITSTDSSANTLEQYLSSLKDGTYTVAAKVNGEIKTRICSVSGTTVTTIDNSNAAYTGGYLSFAYSSVYNVFFVSISANSGGNSVSVEWAALYEGSYTADTLPAYVPKGYAAELAECQRYYYQTTISNAVAVIASGHAHTSEIARFVMTLPQPMRIKPSFSFTAGSYIRIMQNGSTFNGSDISLNDAEDSTKQKMIFFVTSSGLTSYALAGLMIPGSTLKFSADL